MTTAGEVALGVALDEPPPGWRLVNSEDAKGAMAGLLSGGGVTVAGEAPWLAGLPPGEGLQITAGMAPVATGPAHLHFAPQRVTLGRRLRARLCARGTGGAGARGAGGGGGGSGGGAFRILD